MSTTIGTLCTGIHMLHPALTMLYGPVDTLWHAEVDPDAAKVLAHHQPHVPNLGDITGGYVPTRQVPSRAPQGGPLNPDLTRRLRDHVMRRLARIKWAVAPRVAVLVGTIPCQGNSHAGKRLGGDDYRNLWPAMAGAIDAQQPDTVLFENVTGLLTVDGGRLFGQVLADLDRAGYHVRWTVVGSCKIGAPHHRHRLFLAATRRHDTAPKGWPIAERDRDRWVRPQADLFGGQAAHGGWPQAGVALNGQVWERPADPCGTNGLALLPTPMTPNATDAQGGPRAVPERRTHDGPDHGPRLRDVAPLLPTPTVADSRGTRNATSGRTAGEASTHNDGWTLSDVAHADRWGVYGDAIRRWEAIHGPAPEPTEPNTTGGRRLSAALPEWMLGLPPGYVTDHVGRNAALRICGNGVQTQAAAVAFSRLLPASAPVERAA